MSSLTEIYTQEQLLAMLTEARTAHHKLVMYGTVQEVRTIDRLTRFHQANVSELLAWIRQLEAALGLCTARPRSSPVYF